MVQRSIVKHCRDLGCCDACCIRYLGLKNPSSYDNVHRFIDKYLDEDANSHSQNSENEGHLVSNLLKETAADAQDGPVDINSAQSNTEGVSVVANDVPKGKIVDDSTSSPPAKKMKMDDVCVSCLGVLQEKTWPEAFAMVQDVLKKKRYECETIACALSSPIAAILRERAISLHLEQACPGYEHKTLMPLKEAWKWLFGRKLATIINKRLDSGAVAPLLVTLNIEYPEDMQELEVARALAPALFESRSKQRRRFAVEFTRRSVEQALAGASLGALAAAGWGGGPPRPAAAARAVGALAAHAPVYVGGRYLKLSRALPQTPWLVAGRRMMHSSVQEIIFEPVAAAYGLSPEEGEQKLKLISAGREDVDVRCLGTGRPFALEIADPRRAPDAEELRRVCERISAERKVIVRSLVPITREDLTLLKQGEQTKCKTYDALCIKLGASGGAESVTERDIANINSYRNTAADDAARVRLVQRTPLRVLHRRPLLARRRALLALGARAVPGRPALFALRLRTEAGTYVKEWAHGELRRTRPALADALGARADILALDVADVDLPWPPAPPPPSQ